MRIGTIDLGSNTALLLIAERDASGGLRAVDERAVVCRIGQGLGRGGGQLLPDARERTLAVLAQFGRALRAARVERVAAVATAGLRDAADSELFIRQASAAIGHPLKLISGIREAELTFAAPFAEFAAGRPLGVIDVGGRSTELIWGRREALAGVHSLPLGSVALSERHLSSDPPTAAELAAVRDEVQRKLAGIDPVGLPRRWVTVAGTATTLAAIEEAVAPYDPKRIHGSRLDRAQLGALVTRLAALPLAQRRLLPGLSPERADVIVAGAILLDHLLATIRCPQVIISDRGLRWGLAYQLLG